MVNSVAQVPMQGVSMLYSFDDIKAAERQETQYFEMLGNRGIWHDGWKAVTWHRPGTPFDADQWELYHLDKDFNELHDLGQEQPEKLTEMVGRWFAEAGAYKVLPMNDTIARFVSQNPYSVAARTHWELRPGSGRIPRAAAPDIRNRSYTITAEVEIPAGGAEGVLVAQGDWCGGYALYIRDGHLVHDYNFVNRHHVVRSDRPVPTGPCTLQYEMRKTGPFQGEGTLRINGEACGTVELPQTYRAQASFIGLEVGKAPKPSVGEFEAPYAFTGTLHKVVYDLADDQKVDAGGELRGALRQQ
jgi:arylsulfatase